MAIMYGTEETTKEVIPVKVDAEGKLLSKVQNDALAAAAEAGLAVDIFAVNPDLDTGIEEDIWAFGGTRQVTGEVLRNLSISSSSSNDTVGGSGIWSFNVIGLDTNKDLITENVLLQGTTPVNLTNSYLEVLKVEAISPSSPPLDYFNRVLDGDVTLIDTTDTNTWAFIVAGDTTSHLSHYTVPAGYNLLLTRIFAGTADNGENRVKFQYRLPNGSPWVTFRQLELRGNHVPISGLNSWFPSGTKFRMRGLSITNNNRSITAGYNGILLPI